ncbi:flagellar filament capping protein FliD [Cohnella faecalis]|uniref:Flagellar hook-associated protein 2 n=1 Tax=Cohnella faecalis TaxID=2315694 RepID=A0A398CI05_9BACL|nr:flagellar filament capping protein FliD [Cohnella faecalis]RIE02070.1 hypothetical protein D3H35_15005 [Cohnella faecalis]
MTIRVNGLGSSGLDIDTLVSQMVQAKRVPIDQMKQKMTYLGWQRDAYRDMNTEMTNFMKEAQKLTLQSSFMTKKAAMSAADADKVKVSPTSGAFTGNMTLKVTQLAKAASLTSSAATGLASNPAQALGVDTTLTIAGAAGSKDISILSGDSVTQVVSKINAQSSSTGVKAVYDKLSDRFSLVSSQTGEASTVQIIDQGNTNMLFTKLKIAADGANDTTAIQGQDAIVDFNGTGDVHVGSNTFTMNNINFTLLTDPGVTPYTISASNNIDVESVISTIKGVFEKYNALIEKTNGKLSETKYRDFSPLTDSQKEVMKEADITMWNQKAQSGLLRNDSILSSGLNKMRLDLSNNVSGLTAGQYKSLADIGITTAPPNGNLLAYTEQGKIYIDEDKLRNALTNAPEQVMELFTKDGTRDANNKLKNGGADAGIGVRLYESLKSEVISGLTQKTQIVPSRSYLNLQLDDYAKRISVAESSMSDYEQKLYSQFSKMQSSLEKLNKQGSYLSNMFQSN